MFLYFKMRRLETLVLPKPLKFYNRKSKAKWASKLDADLLVGESFLGLNALPDFLPLGSRKFSEFPGFCLAVQPFGS